ncbi:type III pantothenate kinase [Nitrosomonas sp. wSCUT-2]
MSMILAIDSGNSFFKWGLKRDDLWLTKGQVSNSEFYHLLHTFKKLPSPVHIIISHVAANLLRDELEEAILSIWAVKPHWIKARVFQCGVFNCYRNPEQLGSDRWAALVAAWNLNQRACIVVNVGTAVTIDVLSDSGEFLGGVIIPGAYSMRESLQLRTKVRSLLTGTFQDFPQSTDDAVHTGLVHCMLGAIERFYHRVSEQLNAPALKCFISGGGSTELIPFIGIPFQLIDNLVLEGLIIIAHDIILSQNKLSND